MGSESYLLGGMAETATGGGAWSVVGTGLELKEEPHPNMVVLRTAHGREMVMAYCHMLNFQRW